MCKRDDKGVRRGQERSGGIRRDEGAMPIKGEGHNTYFIQFRLTTCSNISH